MLKNSLYRIQRKVLVVFLLTSCMLFPSCDDFLNVDPNHVAGEEQQWKHLEDTRSALMGIYGLMRSALAENNTHWLCGDLRMGDFTVYNRKDLQSVVDNELLKPYASLEEISNWRRFYAVINAAAVFIEKAPQVVGKDKSYSDLNLAYDVAQARALRAFAYFYMVRMWEDVPLLTLSYDNGSFPPKPRTDARTVLNYAKGELLESIPNLPFAYGTSTSQYYRRGSGYWRGISFNKLSAYALLAHIAAWEGNYVDVETYTAFIMDHYLEITAKYTTIADLVSSTGLFSSDASESIKGSRIIGFGSPSLNNESTQSGHIEQLTLAEPFIRKIYPDIYLTKDSLNSIFDDWGDVRFGIDTLTMKYQTNYIYSLNSDIPVFSKIKVVKNGSKNKNDDYGVFGSAIVFTRLEEIVLLRAEALVALHRGTDALVYYNTVRKTRGFAEAAYKKDFGNDDAKLLHAIFEERRKELMGEGWRWYDLIRRQKLLKDNEEMDRLIREGGIYWPIAQDVLSANSLIEQNNYWK